ncbi:hypothetical protein [Alienimonas californiensis]|uniref:Uncharacterized protein n=1 Tax=Alienimonas californiensis TaxID=2527989 RepID=A0A517P9F6_9PLAN|nr:hypothetical protein [Alienimonas californiensis]QDT16009.1 hypothetical protein CA12_21070 [Alienimonas californiensis]
MSDSTPPADQLFLALLETAPPTVAGFVRPILPPEGSGESLGDRVGETTPEGEAILPRLRETPGDRLLPERPGKPAELVKAGLLLLHGDLDASHRISQAYEGDRDADAWHALMHRLEGDYGNSGYWWRRVGAHPIFADLAQLVGEPAWDPQEFTDRLRRALRGGDEAERAAVRSVQAAEFALLLQHCER